MNSWWVGLDRQAFYEALHATEAKRIIRENEKPPMFDPLSGRFQSRRTFTPQPPSRANTIIPQERTARKSCPFDRGTNWGAHWLEESPKPDWGSLGF